ncbi:DinB family protein [Robertmurraya sp.]|jgi:uncharacterized damage-inducible protein DinB|uniref:DinB family protein n=1 Tax=Robertmurraya sp. TaxID=2837525 RepID=UPI0037046BB1
MNKVEITQAYESLNQWFQSLTEVDEQKWFAPIEEGKWSMAAVLSHLLFWDRFSLKERFPFMKEAASLPSFPDFQTVNDKAREYAESGITKNELLQELIYTRMELLSVISSYSEEDLDTSFSIGDHQFTIREYFVDFIQHDYHHKNQIEVLLS